MTFSLPLTLHEIARITGAKNDMTALPDLPVHGIEFDSRLVKPGDLFLPLKGTRDGHEFISAAFDSGAVATFTEHPLSQPHLLVDDCLVALQTLARQILEQTRVSVIAITGSNGKTTTKDMIAAVLSQKYATYKTQGNHNTEIGLPYTVLHMPGVLDARDTPERLVLEMGMDHPDDIRFLSELAKPSRAVITLIGEAHLEFMGSREAIARGKMGITAGLPRDAELIVPADPIINPYIPENQRITRFGPGEDIYITKLVEHKDYLSFETNFLDETLTVPLPGRFNATNAMLAAYVGLREGVSPAQIKQALASVALSGNRTQWLKAANGADILSDVYNANPTAMRLVLETFQAIPPNPGGRKIAVLADMLELGSAAPTLHAGLADNIDLTKLDGLYLYGPMMKFLADRIPSARYFTELEPLAEDVKTFIRPKDQLLVKGSFGMHMSRVIEALE